jgi:hypothetical protein
MPSLFIGNKDRLTKKDDFVTSFVHWSQDKVLNCNPFHQPKANWIYCRRIDGGYFWSNMLDTGFQNGSRTFNSFWQGIKFLFNLAHCLASSTIKIHVKNWFKNIERAGLLQNIYSWGWQLSINENKYPDTRQFIQDMLKKWLSSTTCKIFQIVSVIFQKVTCTLFNVSVTTVQGLKNVRLKVWEELITQSRCRLFKTSWKNYQVPTTCKFFGKMIKFNYMEIFRKMSEHFQKVTCTSPNVSIRTVQGLKNVSQKVKEKLITQS